MKLWFLFFCVAFGENVLKPKVQIPLGILEGSIGLTRKNTPFFSFKGVPYTEKPIGDLRFEDPVPIKPWTGIRAANKTTKCLQYYHFEQVDEKNYLVVGDEDCLFLNIFTHSLDEASNADVLVHIHGGAFMFGSGHSWGPEIIMEKNIVYVTFNYRLGPLGFLSTEDDVIPGNMGLKDQTMALKWIKENIKYFGGNPNSVTIWGLSAGGASVHLHYLMPQSQGLFKQGLSQSGCALNSWVLAEHSLEKAKKLATHVGCPTTSTIEIKKCLKKTPAKSICEAVKLFQPWLYNPFSPFGVVIDSWSKNPVLEDHPYNLLHQQEKVYNVPWIISYTTAEGLYPASDFYREDRYIEELDKHWNEIMPYILHYNESVDASHRDKVSKIIRKYYMEDKSVTRETFTKFVEIVSDRLFIADIEKAARLHNALVKSNIYSYVFDYKGASGFSHLISGSEDDLGVSHADDTVYIANGKVDTQTTEEDRQMSEVFAEIFLSYMRTGKPSIQDWLPLRKSESTQYQQLRISSPTNLFMEEVEEIGHRKFWDSLPFKENHYFRKTKKDEL